MSRCPDFRYLAFQLFSVTFSVSDFQHFSVLPLSWAPLIVDSRNAMAGAWRARRENMESVRRKKLKY
jgi:hypothetical protein